MQPVKQDSCRRNILIVDDDQDVLAYLCDLVVGKYDFASARDGLAALDLFRQESFDLVLSDVRMPRLGGIQLLEAIKSISSHCEVILMTGYADLDAVIKALNQGAFAFVTKPLDGKNLLGRIGHAIAVIRSRETTEQVLQEIQQDLLRQTLFAQRLSALAALSGGIAHELNQPLSGINLYAEQAKVCLAQQDIPGRAALLEMMDKIIRQVDRSSRIVRHIRDFSSHDEDWKPSVLSLGKEVERAMELFTNRIKAHCIELVLEIPPDLRVKANSNRLEQVVVNLVSNSLDSIVEQVASRPGHNPSPHHHITLRGFQESSRVVLEIGDSGGGIPEKLKNALFEPFVSGKTSQGGSGLGLFICRQVLRDYGANIELHSTGCAGTTFRLQFPAI